MCDYSLHCVETRPAKVGDLLVSSSFPGTATRGFTAAGEPNVAICVLPGTELAFEREVEWERFFRFLPARTTGHKVARFRQVDAQKPAIHHDALEFPGGEVILLTRLREGQRAVVLQLPASVLPEPKIKQAPALRSVELIDQAR